MIGSQKMHKINRPFFTFCYIVLNLKYHSLAIEYNRGIYKVVSYEDANSPSINILFVNNSIFTVFGVRFLCPRLLRVPYFTHTPVVLKDPSPNEIWFLCSSASWPTGTKVRTHSFWQFAQLILKIIYCQQ